MIQKDILDGRIREAAQQVVQGPNADLAVARLNSIEEDHPETQDQISAELLKAKGLNPISSTDRESYLNQ
jgi:hypothetical protein